jgi:hypothetical protein
MGKLNVACTPISHYDEKMSSIPSWHLLLSSHLHAVGAAVTGQSPADVLFLAFKETPDLVADQVAQTSNGPALMFALLAAATIPRLDIFDALLLRPEVQPKDNRSQALKIAVCDGNTAAVERLYSLSDVGAVADDLSSDGAWAGMEYLLLTGVRLGLPKVAQDWVAVLPQRLPRVTQALMKQEALDRAERALALNPLEESRQPRNRARP